MSVAIEQPVGATNVPIELVLNDVSGGVAGETPTIALRRTTDNAYLDFGDNTFKTSGWTSQTLAMTDRGGGRYSYTWDSSGAVTVPGSVIVEYNSNSVDVPGIDHDVIIFTNSAAILENIAKSPLASVGDGSGSCKFVYTITIAGSSSPIEQAIVYVTSDLGGSNIIAGPKQTDEDGKVTFYLNPGTHYFWRNKGGITFTNPDIETF